MMEIDERYEAVVVKPEHAKRPQFLRLPEGVECWTSESEDGRKKIVLQYPETMEGCYRVAIDNQGNMIAMFGDFFCFTLFQMKKPNNFWMIPKDLWSNYNKDTKTATIIYSEDNEN